MSGRRLERSQALHQRALRTIPLGSQTYSKSALQWVVGAAPLFLDRGKGCHVWDVDGNQYLDYVLGLLPVVLGYCDPDVDEAIRRQLARGISFSLSTELEAELAERLVRLIPCAEKVRFGKNGSDATAAAIRLARAATGRDRVAMCGYHGWHDWCISTTSRNLGVPEQVRALTDSFVYNDPASLERLLASHPAGYAAIILEPAGVASPAPGFLESVRDLATRHGAILVFDEIVTGFRIDLGGAQSRYGVIPDLTALGKSLGNGMPISAIVGRASIMDWMDQIFFSGTFSGEALSLAAAIATLDKLESTDGVRRIHAAGERLAHGLAEIIERHGLTEHYQVEGDAWWPRLAVTGAAAAQPVATSLLRQELAAHGVLSSGSLNLCLAHTEPRVIEETLRSIDQAASSLQRAFSSTDPARLVRGKLVEPIFRVR